MAGVSKELHQVFKMLVCTRCCQSFLKELCAPSFSVTLLKAAILASPNFRTVVCTGAAEGDKETKSIIHSYWSF